MSGTGIYAAYPATPTTVLGRVATATVGVFTELSVNFTNEWTRRLRRNQATKASGTRRGPLPPLMYPMLDPTAIALPWKWQLRDRCAFVVDVSNAGTAPLGIFGFCQMLSDVDPPKFVGIGFYVRGGDNQWYAFIKDSSDDATIRDVVVVASGMSASVLRNLQIELDGFNKTVTWWIDGTQITKYDFSATGLRLDKTGIVPTPMAWAMWTDGVTVPAQDASIYSTMGNSFEALVHELPDALSGGGPDKPVISIAGTGPQFVDLAGSAYSHPAGIAHRLSIWQIDELGGDFSTPVKEVVDGPPSSLVAQRISGLSLLTTYFARVLYLDANFSPSPWSDAIAFSTDASGFTCGDAPATSYACADP